jgi:hypothetical protein
MKIKLRLAMTRRYFFAQIYQWICPAGKQRHATARSAIFPEILLKYFGVTLIVWKHSFEKFPGKFYKKYINLQGKNMFSLLTCKAPPTL